MRIQSETPQDFFFPPSSCFLMMSFTKAHSQDGGLLIFSSTFCVFFFCGRKNCARFERVPCSFHFIDLTIEKSLSERKKIHCWHRYQTVVWLAPSPFFFYFFAFLYIFPFIISQCVKLRKSAVAFSPRRNLSIGERLGLLESLCVFRRLTERPTPTHNANSVILFFFFSFFFSFSSVYVCCVFLFAREPPRRATLFEETKTHSCVTPAGALVSISVARWRYEPPFH